MYANVCSLRWRVVTVERFGVRAEVGTLQGDLFAQGRPGVDPGARVQRRTLDETSWIDTSRRWLRGADDLLGLLAASLRWTAATRTMYDRVIEEPRLGAHLRPGSGGVPDVINEMAAALNRHYRTRFDSVWVNYYRGGSDSVAWHSDSIGISPKDAIVVVVSLGGPRHFLLRPRGGGRSMSFKLASGDLLVMGGACQHGWEHSVPKRANAQPRMSVTFRRTTPTSDPR